MEKRAYKLFKELEKSVKFFKSGNAMKLRNHSNEVIRHAALEGDKELALIAMVSYVLHKLMTKQHIVTHVKWKSNKASLLDALQAALSALKAGNFKKFDSSMNTFDRQLHKIDSYFSRFVQSLMHKARVKYAADAYFFGLSMSSAAELTGAERKRLQEYIGATTVTDKEKQVKGIKDRLNKLKEVLKE